MDLDAYFARIGYRGSRAPTAETLHALTRAHTSSIPFENLDVLLGRRIHLGTDALLEKLVRQRRGGYCFEQNGLLYAVLLAMGFDARPLSARVRIDRPRDYTPPRTHVFVRVEIGGTSYLTDVGVGALSLTGALRLDTQGAQDTPHEPRRIVREEGRFFHQARLGDDWKDVCEFTLEEMPLIDREMGSFYASTHPDSSFKVRLLAARALPDGARLTLLNDELSFRDRHGKSQVTKIASRADLLATLRAQFGLEFPGETRFGLPGSTWPSD